jgi:type IV pilus assembly protein PilW
MTPQQTSGADRLARIRRALQDDRGFTLVELLVSMVLGLLVLGIIVSTGTLLGSNAASTNKVTSAQDQGRIAITTLTADLRSAGTIGAVATTPVSPIVSASSSDLVVSAPPSGGTPVFVRYCTATVGSGSSATVGLRRLTYTGPAYPAAGSVPACPASSTTTLPAGWTYGSVVDAGLTAGTTPFTYQCATSGCNTATTPAAIGAVGVALRIDDGRATPLTLDSAIALRNRTQTQ